MVEIIQFLGILICSGLLISTVITQKMDKRNKKKSLESDNPFILTIQSMESELAELLENNRHMERIQRLEEQIKEARAHAEALSKIAGEYGSTMEEIGESIVGGIGGRNAIHTVTPVDSNGIVVGGLLSKGLVIEKPEEVGEPMRHSTPNRKKLDGGSTRQNTAIYRTYTSQKGWSSYYDVKLK